MPEGSLQEDVGIGSRHPTSLYIFEAPVRIWHWITASSVMLLCLTGYLIAEPLPTIAGEASDYYLMGYVRFVHFAAGYVLGVGMLVRIYWAVVGNRFAREIFYIPIWSRLWTNELLHQIGWMLFLVKRPHKYAGHNPLAHLALFTFFLIPILFELITGFAMYAEAGPKDAPLFRLFEWVIALFPNTQDLHTWHHAGMWVLVLFMIFHIYMTVREDIMSRQSMVSTMISGHRMFKDDQP